MRGDLDGAIEEYLRAVTLDPSYTRAHHSLARAYLEKGNVVAAAEHYARARELGLPRDRALESALAD
jgi:Tfp pilus assembly protein PilF